MHRDSVGRTVPDRGARTILAEIRWGHLRPLVAPANRATSLKGWQVAGGHGAPGSCKQPVQPDDSQARDEAADVGPVGDASALGRQGAQPTKELHHNPEAQQVDGGYTRTGDEIAEEDEGADVTVWMQDQVPGQHAGYGTAGSHHRDRGARVYGYLRSGGGKPRYQVEDQVRDVPQRVLSVSSMLSPKTHR